MEHQTVNAAPTERLLAIKDASQKYGLPEKFLRRKVFYGEIESVRWGRRVFIRESALDAIITALLHN